MNITRITGIFTKPDNPLPLPYYWVPVLILSIAGLVSSVYLSVSHYRVYTDIGYQSFCAISPTINCDTVSQSAYSILLGVPVPVWGVYGYVLVLFLVVLAGLQQTPRRRIWPLLFWVTCLFSAYSLVLAAVSTFLIQSYCAMCVVTYLVNFLLMYYAWIINSRFGDAGVMRGLVKDLGYLAGMKRLMAPIAFVFLFSGAFMLLGFPEYWQFKPPVLSRDMPKGVTDDGRPWIGAEEPDLVIEEYSDYMCFYCRKMHYHLRHIIEANPGSIRLVHYHFPMDHNYNPIVNQPYHTGSGALALLAIHAAKHGKFWDANDLFLSLDTRTGSISLSDIASRLGLDENEMRASLNDQNTLRHLQKDILKGLSLGITGTPGFVIDGTLYEGHIPASVLREYLTR